MTIDTVEFWWDPAARSPYPDEGTGAFCYVDNGARHQLGAYPKEDHAFGSTCFSGAQ
jgi:hypothetical protein